MYINLYGAPGAPETFLYNTYFLTFKIKSYILNLYILYKKGVSRRLFSDLEYVAPSADLNTVRWKGFVTASRFFPRKCCKSQLNRGSTDCNNEQSSRQNRIKNSIETCIEISMIFWRFWESFLKAFGSILAFKSRSKFDHDFGMLFCRIPGRDAASTDRRRIVDGSLTGVPVPRIPLGGAPFRARGDLINA